MTTTIRCVLGVLAGLGLAAGVACKLDNAAPDDLTGPSELGTSVTLMAEPDVLTLDGASASRVTVVARDANAQPIPNLQARVEIVDPAGLLSDFGRLSARSIVTGADGRATVTYTAPLVATLAGGATDPFALVTILVTPAEGNFANALPRSVLIRLVPPGTILPPVTFVPDFTFTPLFPAAFERVTFDATAGAAAGVVALTTAANPDVSGTTDPNGQIASFRWDFGDGTTARGAIVTHEFTTPGNFAVTLTASDQFGRSLSVTKTVGVDAAQRPTASFVVSPSTGAVVRQTIFFNASASTAAAGREIATYTWDFGDGTSASGRTTSHVYENAGSYRVTLTVTDDVGETHTVSQSVSVAATSGLVPEAIIVFSPEEPAVGQKVFFDGTTSTAPSDRTIVSWDWNFGDGAVGSGPTPEHTYPIAGTYNVVLTVTDSSGVTDTATASILVGSADPTANFTASPSPGAVASPITMDASASSAKGGATITKFTWDFGSVASAMPPTAMCPGPSPCGADGTTVVVSYSAAGSYAVTLTVTDSLGRTDTIVKTVTVE